MSNTYWEDRKKEQIIRGNQAADAVVKDLSLEYQKCLNQVTKDLSVFYAMYGKNNILEYQELLKTMSNEEVDMLYKEIDDFFEKYNTPKALKANKRKVLSVYSLTRFKSKYPHEFSRTR